MSFPVELDKIIVKICLFHMTYYTCISVVRIIYVLKITIQFRSTFSFLKLSQDKQDNNKVNL